MRPIFRLAALCVVLALAAPARAEPLHTVISVYDGDTLRTREEGSVRVAGIDAPEIGWRARCPAEQSRAIQARDWLKVRTAGGVDLRRLSGPDREKYGRLLRTPFAPDGANIADELVTLGLAVRYNGRGARPDWCKVGG